MKKFSTALLIALWALYGVACAALPDQDIVILYTNDVHCGVGENIGYAGLAFYKDEIAAGKAARMPEDFGGLLHTAGLSYTIDATIPTPVQVDDKNRFIGVSGDRRRVRDVKVGGLSSV